MGKFSEALKRNDRANTEPAAAPRAPRAPAPSRPKPDRHKAVDSDKPAPPAALTSRAASSRSSVQREPMQPEAESAASEVHPSVDDQQPEPAGPAGSEGKSVAVQEKQRPQSPPISVLAPKTAVTPDAVSPEGQSTLAPEAKSASNVPGAETEKKDVRVSYSKTKVQVNDPDILRNNRVISLFDDIETNDQIKILRRQVLKKLKEIGGNSILVTSANPYEGKTFTSINLGVSIAKEFDRTVLIIDADIRKPTQRHTSFATEFFSLNVEKGLTDYLLGEVEIPDILINPGINKLTLIPGGKPVANAPELLNADRMEQMMLEIKSRYSSDRIVIVDGPALLPFPDAMILSRYTHGVLAVIEAERTPTEDVKKMMNLLRETTILGTVLNKNKE